MSRSRRLSFLFFLPLVVGSLASCRDEVHHRLFAYAYGTNWQFDLYEGDKEFAQSLVEYAGKTSRLLDMEESTQEGGLAKLNQDGVVRADPFLIEAIELGWRIEGLCLGAYSITLGRLTSRWLDCLQHGEKLPEAEVGELVEEAKATTIQIDGDTVTKSGNGWLDLGSIGKGLCLKHIQEKLKQKGITRYLVNAGTSSMLFGQTPKGGEVKVNLINAPGRYFYAKDCAVSTSSGGQEAYTVNGVKYSHIIDARTGSAEVKLDALTLQGADPALLDGLSTGYLSLGVGYADQLEEMGIKAAYCHQGKAVYESEGFLQ